MYQILSIKTIFEGVFVLILISARVNSATTSLNVILENVLNGFISPESPQISIVLNK